MHKAFRHMIEEGDVYYVTFPKFPDIVPDGSPPSEYWHKTTVYKMLDGVDPYGRPAIHRMDSVPLGSRAIVIRKPGETAHIATMCEQFTAFSDNDPTMFVECLIVEAETEAIYKAVMGITELWDQDPRIESPNDEAKES